MHRRVRGAAALPEAPTSSWIHGAARTRSCKRLGAWRASDPKPGLPPSGTRSIRWACFAACPPETLHARVREACRSVREKDQEGE